MIASDVAHEGQPITEQPAVTDKPPRRRPNRNKQCVYTELPRCPTCQSANLITRRTKRHPDGAINKDTICRGCGELFIIVAE